MQYIKTAFPAVQLRSNRSDIVSKSVQDIMDMIQEHGIKMVDFKMVDINGQYRHVTILAENFTEDTMKKPIENEIHFGFCICRRRSVFHFLLGVLGLLLGKQHSLIASNFNVL